MKLVNRILILGIFAAVVMRMIPTARFDGVAKTDLLNRPPVVVKKRVTSAENFPFEHGGVPSTWVVATDEDVPDASFDIVVFGSHTVMVGQVELAEVQLCR